MNYGRVILAMTLMVIVPFGLSFALAQVHPYLTFVVIIPIIVLMLATAVFLVLGEQKKRLSASDKIVAKALFILPLGFAITGGAVGSAIRG